MHYICIITVIYIMYTNVSMLMYVIEPKKRGKGKIVRLPKRHERRKINGCHSVYSHASRRSCCGGYEQEQHTRAARIFYIHNKINNIRGHIRKKEIFKHFTIFRNKKRRPHRFKKGTRGEN